MEGDQRYAALLPYVKTRLDLNYIIGEMIGELGVGHAYVNPGEVESPKRVSMGLLGAEVSRDKSGFFRLERSCRGLLGVRITFSIDRAGC